MKWLLIAFVFAVLLMKAVHPTHSQSATGAANGTITVNVGTDGRCPPDTIAREVVDYTQPVSCFAHAIFALRCPKDDGACERYLENTCTPPVTHTECLTKDVLERAQQR